MSEEIISFTNPALGPLPTKAPQLPSNVLDLFSLKGKVASVTGSSGGIGWAVAEAFAQAGADVATTLATVTGQSATTTSKKSGGVSYQPSFITNLLMTVLTLWVI